MTTKKISKVERKKEGLNVSKSHLLVVLCLIIFCATIVASAHILTKTDFYIKNIGTETTQDGKLVNTISVSGDSKVYTTPDMATISVTVQKTEKDSKTALEEVNKDINKIQDILEKNGVKNSDIKTTSLNIHPDYDWDDGDRILVGQEATQTISFTVKNLDEKATKAGKIIDEIGAVDNVRLSGVSFDVEDKTELYSQARESAYKKAKSKAEELAKLGGVRLLKPVSITDSNVEYNYMPVSYDSSYSKIMMDEAGSYESTQISTGEMHVTATVSVVYGIE